MFVIPPNALQYYGNVSVAPCYIDPSDPVLTNIYKIITCILIFGTIYIIALCYFKLQKECEGVWTRLRDSIQRTVSYSTRRRRNKSTNEYIRNKSGVIQKPGDKKILHGMLPEQRNTEMQEFPV
jgi:hypothetical protein